MSDLSNYAEQALLDLLLNADAFSAPDIYLALYTADPTDADSGTEVSGGSYARQRIYPNGGSSPAFTLAASDPPGFSVENANEITFPTATVAWGEVTHFGLKDALTAGNLIFHQALDVPKTVGVGDVFRITAGNLTLRLE